VSELEFVVRTVGERTEEVCVELVNRQKSENEKLHVLRENTHAKAVESTISVGLESGADWLVAIDADMLLTDGSIKSIRNEIQACSDSIAVIHPAVVDKMYRMRRWGLTVYRKAALEELNKMFQEIKLRQNTKIESAAIKALGENKQRQVYFSREVAAVHDFYQYYKDLYRKAYLNVSRNQGFNKEAKKCWKRLAKSDHDYLVMYKAMNDATSEKRDLTNSISDFKSSELDRIVCGLGLEEKQPLRWADYVDQCCSAPLEAEIKLIDKDHVFNDYFESTSISQKLKAFLRG